MRRWLPPALAAAWLVATIGVSCAAKERKLVVAVMDGVAWHDLLDDRAQAPTLRKLAGEGAVGMMCVRTVRTGQGGYLTMGAGARAAASAPVGSPADPEGQGFHTGEMVEGTTAGARYQAYTGSVPGSDAIVHLGIGDLTRQNLLASYPVRVGLLGDELERAGLRVACVGNADTAMGPHREIVALAMNQRGTVPLGNVGGGLARRSPATPGGLATDRPRFLEAFAEASKAADVIFVELGETARAGEYIEEMTPAEAVVARRRAIERSDRLLGDALSMMPKEGWAVMVLTPVVRLADPEEQLAPLAPVILGGPEAQKGLLTSPSTRRVGVVVNTDVAATVLEFFGLPRPADTVGRAMATVAVAGATRQWLSSQVKRQDEVEAVRRYVFRWLPVLVAVGMWSAALLLLLGERAPYWARVIARGLLAVAFAAPVAALLSGVYPMSLAVMGAVVAGGAVVIGLVSGWATMWRSAQVAPAIMLAVALIYDLVRGQQMLAWSPLSYSAAAGSRFYGVGNEYAGALLGAALVGVAGALGSRASAGIGKRLAAAVALLAVAVLVGHPRFGANLGVALACAIGFGVFMLYLWRDEPGWREVAAVGLLVFGMVGAAAMADVFLKGGDASHVGMLAASVKAEGWTALWDTVSRKFAMNMLLVRTSTWSDAALGALAAVVVLLAARPGRAIAAMREQEWLQPAVVACVIGAAAAFALNDSGVVAAGMALLFGVGALGYAALGGGKA